MVSVLGIVLLVWGTYFRFGYLDPLGKQCQQREERLLASPHGSQCHAGLLLKRAADKLGLEGFYDVPDVGGSPLNIGLILGTPV